MNKIAYILLSLGAGAAVGCVVGYLAKRHYEKFALNEIDNSDKYWGDQLDKQKQIISDKNDMIDFALREIYELREACRIILDPGQYETIFEQVKYKMKALNESMPELRNKVEESLDICKRWLESYEKTVNRQSAEDIADALGYSGSGDDEDSSDDIKEKRLYGIKKREALRRKAEANMDDGSEEFDDMPRLTPNGDIMDDEAEDEEDEETWTSDAQVYVSGDDIVSDEPYLISERQFIYGKQDYDKVSLEYLCLDDVVLDQDETELDQKFIGPDNLLAFEEVDCPSIFIRNDQLEIDYEIMWTEASYTRDILGDPEATMRGRRIWRSWEKGE